MVYKISIAYDMTSRGDGTHLELVGMETNQTTDSHASSGSRVHHGVAFSHATLVNAHVRQLSELSQLQMR